MVYIVWKFIKFADYIIEAESNEASDNIKSTEIGQA